ncbi:MAG: trypsin-like peptidase domain-containing protein [Planctomycetota bacterium]
MTKRMFAAIVAGWLIMVSMNSLTAADSILVAFSSSHCPPCEAMKPTLASLEQAGIPIRRVDVQAEPQLVSRFGIRKTPTFVVVSSGREVTRLVGMQSADQLRAALAIDPTGPLIQTRSTSQAVQAPAETSLNAPQTRLAPVNSMGGPSGQYVSAPSARSEPMPSLSLADAVERAQAATVRLRVHDGNGYGAGTGTIIDTHGEEALVLTCGHLFRENQGKGKIEVDLFVGGQTRTVAGQVIDYDADSRDIALVSIRPGFNVTPVQVIGSDGQIQNGQTAFSFGCDRGADPSRRDTRITGINKYNQHLGVSNLEIAGAPIDGRSGGGLFDSQGRLIGVCNSADYQGDVGIYAGPGNIQWQLQRIGMTDLLARSTPPSSSAPVQPSRPTQNQFVGNTSMLAASTQPAAMNQPAAQVASSNQEVIVIIRDRSRPASNAKVMTLASPSQELMQLIERQAN